MTTKPDGAAAQLEGLAGRLARGLLDDVKALEALPAPDTDIALERRARLRGVIARTALSIRKLQDHEDRPDDPQNPQEADMDDQPDDADAIERKYVELQDFVDRLADRAKARGDQGEGARGSTDHRPGQLAPPGERQAA